MLKSSSARFPLVLLCITFAAYITARYVEICNPSDLRSTDGAFQTLSAVMRYTNGEWPVADFYPYLGIGVSASLVPIYWLTGEHLLLSSNLSAAAMLFFASVGGFAFLFRANGFGWREALLATFGVLALVLFTAFDPGNSLRPLRAALPLIVAALVYALRVQPGLRPADWAGAVKYGLCLSIAPLWSNDFGPATFAAFLLTWIVFTPGWRDHTARNLACLGVILAIVALLNAPVVVAAGGLRKFMEVQSGFSSYQFWYFGPYGPQAQIFTLADLRHLIWPTMTRGPFVFAAAMALLFWLTGLTIVRRWRGRTSAGDGVTLAVGLASVGGAMIPQVGGHIEARYGLYLFNVIIAWALIEASKSDRTALLLRRLSNRRIIAYRSLLVDCGLLSVCVLAAGVFIVRAAQAASASPLHSAASIAVRDKIGVYARDDAEAIACFVKAGEHFRSFGVPAKQRIVSTYLSALNLAADAEQPMKVDSFIHMLGDGFRAENLAMIQSSHPLLLTTINPDYKPWDRWTERVAFDSFGPLFRSYKPIYRTNQHIVWMRMNQAEAARAAQSAHVGEPLPCVVRRHSETSVTLEFDGARVPRRAWAVASLDHSITQSAKGPFAPLRAILTVRERPDIEPIFEATGDDGPDPAFGKRFNRYGLNMAQNPLQIAFDTLPGERAALDLLLEPMKGARLDVRSCTARLAAREWIEPVQRIPRFAGCGAFLRQLDQRLVEAGYRPAP